MRLEEALNLLREENYEVRLDELYGGNISDRYKYIIHDEIQKNAKLYRDKLLNYCNGCGTDIAIQEAILDPEFPVTNTFGRLLQNQCTPEDPMFDYIVQELRSLL